MATLRVGNGLIKSTPFSDDARDLQENAPHPPGLEHEPRPALGAYRAVVQCATEIEPEEVSYLWHPYLPLRKLCLLGGDSGTGKSYLTCAVAAALSRGTWPFTIVGKDSVREPGNTLFFVSEDAADDTYLPRLVDLDADRSHIFFSKDKADWKGNLHQIVLSDRTVIAEAITRYRAQLVVFDPLQSFLPGKAKMNEMDTVRPVLDALILAARETNCVIWLVGHLNKAAHETAGYKFLGSVDWFNGARSAMLIAPNPAHRQEERYFFHVKHTMGLQAPTVGFSIAAKNEPRFLWGQTTETTVEDVLRGTSGRIATKEADAKEFILAMLAVGENTEEQLRAEAKKKRLAWITVRRAKTKLGIHSVKQGFQGAWHWELPKKG